MSDKAGGRNLHSRISLNWWGFLFPMKSQLSLSMLVSYFAVTNDQKRSLLITCILYLVSLKVELVSFINLIQTSHLGSGNFNWEISSTGLACRQDCRSFSWLLIDVGGANPLATEPMWRSPLSRWCWVESKPREPWREAPVLCGPTSAHTWTKWQRMMRKHKPCKSFPPQVGLGHGVYHSRKDHKPKMHFCGLESGPLAWASLACILLMRNVNPLLLQFLEAVSIFPLKAFSHFQSQQWMAKPLPCPISYTTLHLSPFTCQTPCEVLQKCLVGMVLFLQNMRPWVFTPRQ